MDDAPAGHPGDHPHPGDHAHPGAPGVRARLAHLLRPHSHDAAAAVDAAMEASAAGIRALWVSLAALLGDTLHNAADALTAVPLGVAFAIGRRAPTRRYTYGFGRAEDLAGVV